MSPKFNLKLFKSLSPDVLRAKQSLVKEKDAERHLKSKRGLQKDSSGSSLSLGKNYKCKDEP